MATICYSCLGQCEEGREQTGAACSAPTLDMAPVYTGGLG